jgi:hypothetical protein
MTFHRLIHYLLVLVSSALWSCQDCGPTDEPILTLTLQSQTTFRIDTLYGIGATGQPALETQFSNGLKSPAQYATFQLPLNLNADSTRYALLIDGHLETITVFYVRDFYYRNNTCGYVFDLKPRAIDLLQNARTTRGKVATITYTQNSFDGRFLRSSTSETGIQLGISL